MGKSATHSIAISKGLPTLDADGYPDVGAMVWTSLGAARGFADFFNGDDRIISLDLTGTDPTAFVAPEVASPVNTGAAPKFGAATDQNIRVRELESFPIQIPVINPDAGGTYASQPLHQLLESGAEVYDSPTVTTAVTGAGATFGSFTVGVGDGANFHIGEGLEVVLGGVAHHFFVTDIDGDTIHVVGRKSVAWAATDVVRHGRTYAPKSGNIGGANLINIRFDAEDRTHYAFASSMIGLSFALDNRVLVASVTMRPSEGEVVQSPDDTTFPFTRPTGAPASDIQACDQWSIPFGDLSAPETAAFPADFAVSRFLVKNKEVSVTISGEGEEGCTPLARQIDFAITGTEVAMTGETTDVEPFDRMIVDRDERYLLYSYGPPKRGAAFALMAGHLSATETLSEGDDSKAQIVGFSFRNGSWVGDDAVANGLDNTAWRLFFPNPDP